MKKVRSRVNNWNNIVNRKLAELFIWYKVGVTLEQLPVQHGPFPSKRLGSDFAQMDFRWW